MAIGEGHGQTMNLRRRRIGRGGLAVIAAATVLLGTVALGQTGGLGPVSAQPDLLATPPAAPGPTTVRVTGYGSVRVRPDTASAVVGVDVQRLTLAEAQEEATTRATAIIDAIAAAGVAADDIRTTNFGVRVVRDRKRGDAGGQPGETLGYQVSNAVEVTVRDLDQLGRILDDAIAAGANEVRGIAFSVADPAAAAGQSRARAMADARTKADGLASAAGLTISRVVSIAETFSPSPVLASANASGADAAVPLAIGMEEIVVEVQVAYELE